MTKKEPTPSILKRQTRGVQLGNMNENELAKKSKPIAKQETHSHPKSNKPKNLDKELRKHYDKGKAYDEDEDDVADRKNQAEQNEDEKFEALLRDYNNQAKKKTTEPVQTGSAHFDKQAPNTIAHSAVLIDKPIDMAFYKCVQLPRHLNWLNVHARSTELQLI